MKKLKGLLLILLMLVSLVSSARFKKGDWVYWQEVNHSGQKITVIGKVLSKDFGADTYRIEVAGEERWKMHLHKSQLNLIPEKE